MNFVILNGQARSEIIEAVLSINIKRRRIPCFWRSEVTDQAVGILKFKAIPRNHAIGCVPTLAVGRISKIHKIKYYSTVGPQNHARNGNMINSFEFFVYRPIK